MIAQNERPAAIPSRWTRLRGWAAGPRGLALLALAIAMVMTLLLPGRFATLVNLQSMAVQFPEVGILALAVLLSMLSGGIDLSVVAVANLAGVMAALTLAWLVPPETTALATALLGCCAAAAVGLTVGGLCGLVSGWLIAARGVTPILATLGTMSLWTGVGLVITGGTAVFGIAEFAALGSGTLAGIPVPLLIFTLAALLVAYLLRRSAFGFRLRLLGTNALAARFGGIRVERVLYQTYVLSGVLGGLAGLVFLARNNSARPEFAGSYVLQAILVVILGGVDPSGGAGRVSGVVAAIIALQLLSTGFNMLLVASSGSTFFKEFAWGVLLLAVMVIGRWRRGG